MKNIFSDFRGIAVHLVVLGLLLVGVVGFAGYTVYNMNKPAETATTQDASSATEPSTIDSDADLTSASKSLDDSASQMESDLDDSSLDSDLNSLL